MPDVFCKHSSVCAHCSCLLAALAMGLLCTPAGPVTNAVNQLPWLHSCMPGRGMPLASNLAYLLPGTVLVTAETPSTNFVRKMTLALLNIPSFRETTMNWE